MRVLGVVIRVTLGYAVREVRRKSATILVSGSYTEDVRVSLPFTTFLLTAPPLSKPAADRT